MPYNELVAQHPAEIQRYARQFGWQLQFAAAQALAGHSWSYIRGLALASRRSRLDRLVESTTQGPVTPENRLSRRMAPSKKRARTRPNEDVAEEQVTITGQLGKSMYHGLLRHSKRGGTKAKLPVGPRMSSWWRWQGVKADTPRNGPSYPLTLQGDRALSPGWLYAGTPVYAMNMSNMPYSGSTIVSEGQVLTGPAYAPGLYRLYKRFDQTVNGINYFWAPVTGVNNTPTGTNSFTWQFERKSDPSRGYYAPQMYEYQHHYSRASVQFTGTVNYNYRGCIEIVKFKREHGPMRGTLASVTATTLQYHDGLNPSTGNTNFFSTPVSRTTPDENACTDTFWDYKISKMTGSPLRDPTKSQNRSRPYTVLASKVVDMCRVPTTDGGQYPCVCTADVMYTDGGVYNCSHEDQGYDVVNQRYVPQNNTKPFMYYTQGLSDVTQKTGMFADYEHDTWMLIYASSTEHTFNGTESGVLTPAQSQAAINGFATLGLPGFDIVVRSKYTTLAAGVAAVVQQPNQPVDLEDPVEDLSIGAEV